jgi:hypothetical protein
MPISYDIVQILEMAGGKESYRALAVFWDALIGFTEEGRDLSPLMPEEANAFALVNFGMGAGSGVGCRMDFNHPNGIEEMFHAMTAAEALGLTRTVGLFSDVKEVLARMAITRELCRELDVFSLIGLDGIVDASDLLDEAAKSTGKEFDLYRIFERLSAPLNVDERWWNLECAEVNPAVIAYLEKHKEKLRARKP